MKSLYSYLQGIPPQAKRIGHTPLQPDPEITSEDDHGLCHKCRKINFQRLEKRLSWRKPSKGYFIAWGKSLKSLKERQCRLCDFWLRLLVEGRSGAVGYLELRAVSASHKYQLSRLGQHLNTLLLEIQVVGSRRSRLGVETALMTRSSPEAPFTQSAEAIRCNRISPQIDFSVPLPWLNYCKTHHHSCVISNSSDLPDSFPYRL
jgi:hypothetical protein